MELLVDIALLTMLLVTAVYVAVTRDLLAAVMLTGIYGLLSASFFMTMGAVDVAFTEAAVGAGISPLLMLTTLALCGRQQRPDPGRAFFALAIVAVVAGLLIAATLDMPAFGSADAPAQLHVAPRYILDSMGEIGIPNIVTSVLASYRAFDTLGEVVVIFTAGLAVLALLTPAGNGTSSGAADSAASATKRTPKHEILKVLSAILIPPILIFALYVQFHGEYGPGGGFQAGVIFAVGLILYALVFGSGALAKVVNRAVLEFLAAFGVLVFGLVGVLGMLTGKNFLDYSALTGDAISGQHLGIIVIELGVGITVAAVMILIFLMFSSQLARLKES